MKHLITAILAGLVFCSTGWAASKTAPLNNGGTTAGDLVPWPWGTECPFPWNSVDGMWKVKGVFGSKYDRHMLVFETAEDVKAGVRLLYIYHYDQGAQLVGQGTGYSDAQNKFIKAIMSSATGKDSNYQIVVRSYPNSKGRVCTKRGKKAVAVTFCPSRSRDCQDETHYLLEKNNH